MKRNAIYFTLNLSILCWTHVFLLATYTKQKQEQPMYFHFLKRISKEYDLIVFILFTKSNNYY